MKITALLVLKCDPAGSDPVILANAMDVSHFGYFQRPSVREFIVFVGRTVASRTPPSQRQSVQHEEYKVHSYNRDGLCALGFMDDHYPVRSAFSLLNQLIDEYQKNFGQSWRTVQADNAQLWPYLNEALTKFQDPAEADKLLKIQRELDETKIILAQSIFQRHMQKTVGSGSNLDDINESAHILHSAKFKKKSNFDKHWFELRRQPKWRTPSTTESSKRTKLNNSENYSSENNDTQTNENVVESPVRPKGTKAAKRRGKGKARTVEADEEYEELRASACRKLNLMQELNETKQLELVIRQKEIEAKQSEMDLQVILADTTKMTDAQRKAHSKMLEKILARN